jgi:predicted dehydrogenase
MQSEKTPKLRVGIISANWGALAHLPAWRMLDGVEVTAMCTSRPETAHAAAERFGIERPFWDYEAMCADPNIDIIDAGTSPLLRQRMVAAALRHGKHVINQVPFAASLAGAQILVDLQQTNECKGAAAVSVVGLPHLELMREMIADGSLGTVYQVHCSWQMSFFLNIPPGFSYTWFGEAGNGTSVTRNQGSHMLHALLHVFGPISSVSANISNQHQVWTMPDGSHMANQTDDTCHALVDFASGAKGMLTTSWTAADAPGFYIDAFGSKGRLRLEALRYPAIDSARLYMAPAALSMGPNGTEVPLPERLLQVDGKPFSPTDQDLYSGGQRVSLGRLFAGFVRSINEKTEAPTHFGRALEVQRIIEALYESDQEGCRIPTG